MFTRAAKDMLLLRKEDRTELERQSSAVLISILKLNTVVGILRAEVLLVDMEVSIDLFVLTNIVIVVICVTKLTNYTNVRRKVR